MFIHAASSADIERHHLDDQCTIVLVDSVVNSSASHVIWPIILYGLKNEIPCLRPHDATPSNQMRCVEQSIASIRSLCTGKCVLRDVVRLDQRHDVP
jgi:hypothetical protein